MSLKNLDKSQIIRPLGDDECIYDNEILRDNFILTVGALATIPRQYSLRLNIEVLKEAVSIWKNQYPILCSTIYRPFNESNLNEAKIGPPRYFVFDKQQDLSNVYFEKLCLIDYNELIEIEGRIPFDVTRGPYWRMKVIYQEKEQSSDKDYVNMLILYTSHHGINDGKNVFCIFSNFLDVLANTLDKSPIDVKTYESKICMEDMARMYRSKSNYKSLILPNPYNVNFKKVSGKIGSVDCSNRLRMDYFKIEKSKLTKLVSIMKQKTNEAKLNAVLNAVVAICLYKLYDKYQVDDIDRKDLIQIKMVANLRDKLEITNHQMGVYSVILDVQENMSELNEENFWRQVEKSSKDLHIRIDNNEDMEQPGSSASQEFIQMLNAGQDFKDSISHDYILSNLGIMKGHLRSDIIKCDKYFCVGEMSQPNFAGQFYNILVTIDGQLHWSMMFNERLYSTKFISELKVSMIEFFNKIIV